MPRGVPTLGSGSSLPSEPAPAVLGTISDRITDPQPSTPSATWESNGVTVTLTEPPAPWELEDTALTQSDARRFVQVPDNWVLYWANPRLIDAEGWRDWQPVMASDPQVKVSVPTMISPENNIRRGGARGDVLVWMYRSWYESRKARRAGKTAQLTASAVQQQDRLREDFQRGKYGTNIRLDEARHPSHTMAEGRTMRD